MARRGRAQSGLLALAAVLGLGCSSTPAFPDPGLEGLTITAVGPDLIIPGSVLVVDGRSFVSEPWGAARLRLVSGEISFAAPARFVDFDRMEVDVDLALIDALGADSKFVGTAALEVESSTDGVTYASEPVTIELEVRRDLTPALDEVATDRLIFVNDKVELSGSGLLLRASEGTSYASVTGCFRVVGGQQCKPVRGHDIPITPASEDDRTTGSFPFQPQVAGIEAGAFEGELTIRNELSTGSKLTSKTLPLRFDLTESTVFAVTPRSVSLGQYVDIEGGGFLGGDGGGVTLLELSGTFQVDGFDVPVPIDPPLVLVPEFVDGRKVRYVLNEDDALGQAIDLRRVTGVFAGRIDVVTSFDGLDVPGHGGAFSLNVAPVRQVVYLNFRPTYVESLRHFGLRAVDRQIRERIISVVERDYRTVNLEVRTEPPRDFSLYMEVEIAGTDPNGRGFLGNDNTPGKDNGNLRLFDKIGGVNALTQQDGLPGYGGVFVESLFAFSQHPGRFAEESSQGDRMFDAMFDTFRPDRGRAATAVDLSDGFAVPPTAEHCPALTRGEQLGCAVFVIGSLIGTTLSHEMGHALGLADPTGDDPHNRGDAPNRLMDAGANRPFAERAELGGAGPAKFCVAEYEYLREILPTTEPVDPSPRPSCF